MQKTNRIGALVVASFLMWSSVALVDIIASSSLLTGFAVFAAFGSTLALWLVWGLSQVESHDTDQEKAKREAGDDARLALLLSMLDEEERQAIKNRLLDDLSADGESLSLAALLEGQDSQHDQQGHG